MSKPVLLHYCQQSHDGGSLVRAFAIANQLTHRFRVVILNAGEPPVGEVVPAEIELVQLPPLSVSVDTNVMSIDSSATLRNDIGSRCEIILAKYVQCKPRVILIDTFPFGHGRLADELMPLVEQARGSMPTHPLLICGVAEPFAGERHDKQEHDDRITAVLDKYFDAVIVHTDPSFARLGEFLQPRNVLTIPVYHSGFVLRERGELSPASKKDGRVLVSAGSGIDGGSLFRAAIEAHRMLWDVVRLPMTLIAGKSLPDEEWQELSRSARKLPAMRLIRSVPDLGTEFAKVRWVVCDCTYNTTVDMLATRVSALLLPGGNGHKSEQADRSERLAYWHAARMLTPHHLNGASLANSIHQLMKFEPSVSSFNLKGAEITGNLIYHLSLSEEVRFDEMTLGTFTDRPRTH